MQIFFTVEPSNELDYASNLAWPLDFPEVYNYFVLHLPIFLQSIIISPNVPSSLTYSNQLNFPCA